MELNLEPVKVDLQIETPSLERDAFYSLCFIAENDKAPRTLKVERLRDLLDNGYDRLSLAYNFCVGVFSQQGMDMVYIRAKRSSESYVEAYDSDDNSEYYFVVLQTKDLTEIEKFNSHLVSSDEMKLQFFSQNIGSKILKSPKLVNYYQDYTLSGEVPVESKDYYLNKAYGGSGSGGSGDDEAKASYVNIPLTAPPNDSLLFNTYNGYLYKEGGVKTIITISKSSTDWVLKDASGGGILADAGNPIGFISPEIEKRNSAETPDCWDLILNRPNGRTHSYSLKGNIEFVRIITDPDKELAYATGQLLLLELSNYISRYIISAGDCYLTNNFKILPHITNAESMFEGCRSNNTPVGDFDLSNIVNMKNMFKGNIKINNGTSWNDHPEYVDCSSAENMDGMFDGCSSFAQDLSTWCVPKIPSEPSNFGRGAPIIKHPVWGTCPKK